MARHCASHPSISTNFKQINDSFSHPAGDAALKHIAKVLRETLRPNDLLARVGGEEFLVLLPNSNEPAAFAALNRLLRAVASHVVVFGRRHLPVTFTASVALRAFGEMQGMLVKRLDAARAPSSPALLKRFLRSTNARISPAASELRPFFPSYPGLATESINLN